MNSKSRRGLLVGVAASAAVLILAGSAYACTEYVGKVTLTALTATGANGPSVFAEGAPGVHAYCAGETRQTIDMNAANQFKLAIAPASAACGGESVPAGTYDVRWVTAEDPPTTTGYEDFVLNCNPTTAAGFTVGKITVDGSGNSSATTVFLGTTPGKVNVCVVPMASTPATNPDSAPELIDRKSVV